MTPSVTAPDPHARLSRTAPKSAGTAGSLAAEVVCYGFGISVLYFAALVTVDGVVGWNSDVVAFLGCLTPALFLASIAAGFVVLAVRAQRALARAAAALAVVVFGFAAFFVGCIAWTLTMTDWLVW